MSYYIFSIVCILLGIVGLYNLTFQLLKQREEKFKVKTFQSFFYLMRVKEVTQISLKCLYFTVFPLLILEFIVIVSGIVYYLIIPSELIIYINLILSLIVFIIVFANLFLIAKEKKTNPKDYYQKAFKCFNSKKYEESVRILQECLDNFSLTNQEKWMFLSNKAMLLSSIDNSQEAVNACEEAYPYFISWTDTLSKYERKKVIEGNLPEIKSIYNKAEQDLLYQQSWGKV